MAVTKTFPATTLLNGATAVQTSDYVGWGEGPGGNVQADIAGTGAVSATVTRSEEHTSELQSQR